LIPEEVDGEITYPAEKFIPAVDMKIDKRKNEVCTIDLMVLIFI